MSNSKNNHVFTVDLTGLNLEDAHLQRINVAIQNAVSGELANMDFRSAGGVIVEGLHPGIRGKWYIKDMIQFQKLYENIG